MAIGSNLPDAAGHPPVEVCRQAVVALEAAAGFQVTRISRWYRSAPVPPSGQPDFVNGVVRLAGTIAPETLLARLQRIEAAAGRVRGEVNAARVLDLDIIAMGDLVRVTPDPILPHPRAHVRAFVLAPLADVAPDWRHPVSGRSVHDLLETVKGQQISVI